MFSVIEGEFAAMNYLQMKYIVEIVESGSISKAANRLFVSQPNLSNQISHLESDLGKEIFYRSNRGVTLTSFGIEVYEEAKSLVEQFTIIENKLKTDANDHKVKIASFGSEIINFQFYEVCKNYMDTNYEFVLFECGVQEAIERVKTRNCDIAIILYSDSQKEKLRHLLKVQELKLKKIFQGQLKVHVSSQNALSEKEKITSEDLKDLFHVKKDYLFSGMFSLDYELQQLGFPDSGKTIVTNGNKTYNDALHHLPSYAVEIDWKCNKAVPSKLFRIPFEDKEMSINCGIVSRENEVLKQELSYFINKLVEAYA